jgi:mRNA-degrading endonuclease RelE of RelBE toxin-antitoxin system
MVGSDEYKLRIGPYRILAVLSHSEQTILVERVDHRSRIYSRSR